MEKRRAYQAAWVRNKRATDPSYRRSEADRHRSWRFQNRDIVGVGGTYTRLLQLRRMRERVVALDGDGERINELLAQAEKQHRELIGDKALSRRQQHAIEKVVVDFSAFRRFDMRLMMRQLNRM